MSLKLVAIDDEQSALDILAKYAALTDTITNLQVFNDALLGFKYVSEHVADIDGLIIDMDMPELHGTEFLKGFHEQLPIIISSGFSDYAVQGFDYNAVDFLSKPIPYPRFLKAIEKLQATQFNTETKPTAEHLYLKHDGEIFKVQLQDILFLEAFGNYVKVHTTTKTYLISGTMKQFMKELPSRQFYRVHKSHIVNTQHIDRIFGNQITLGEHKLVVGTSYRADFFAYLKENAFGNL